jgi:hypothetical protein
MERDSALDRIDQGRVTAGQAQQQALQLLTIELRE